MQASAITALAVASQNEDLQMELNNARQELLKAQKETYDLRNKLAESQEQVNRLQAENVHSSSSHLANNDYATNNSRGNNQPQQMTSTTAPGVYQAPPYQTANAQMYQNHQAPSQGKLVPCSGLKQLLTLTAAQTRGPAYPPNNRPPAVPNWAPYGYPPQPAQPQAGMWSANMR
jgi:hypothetical protein